MARREYGFCLEQLACLTYAAALTQHVRLLTSVMVVPHRPAILTAKMLATADVLSKGRVTVGVGVRMDGRRDAGARIAPL